MKRLIDSRLSHDVQVCMDAQTAVKQFVKDSYMRGISWQRMQKTLKKIVDDFVDEIELEDLKEQTRKSLYGLAMRVYNTLESSASFGNLVVLGAVLSLYNGTSTTTAAQKAAIKIVLTAPPHIFGQTQTWQWDDKFFSNKLLYGTAVQQRVTYYMRDVTATVKKLAQEKALDENDARTVRTRNSLRATAEIQVRQAGHEREIAEHKANGVNLVICSTHADCSDRCFPWQGKVYSLDGSYGTTDDGREYQPLSNATDVYVSTKAGRVYKNGLLGFNCRHRLIEYMPGRKPPIVSKEQQQKEKAIDQKQREYERAIINARENAIMLKDVDKRKYLAAKQAASKLMREYIKFSHDNGRAYYTSRVRIL